MDIKLLRHTPKGGEECKILMYVLSMYLKRSKEDIKHYFLLTRGGLCKFYEYQVFNHHLKELEKFSWVKFMV